MGDRRWGERGREREKEGWRGGRKREVGEEGRRHRVREGQSETALVFFSQEH